MVSTDSVIFIPILIRKSKQADLTKFVSLKENLFTMSFKVLCDKVLFYKSTKKTKWLITVSILTFMYLVSISFNS